jgi:hypothetical protein
MGHTLYLLMSIVSVPYPGKVDFPVRGTDEKLNYEPARNN